MLMADSTPMPARTLALATAAVALTVAAPPAALAQSVAPPSPAAGDGGTVFTFVGRDWQAGERVEARYYRRTSDPRPFRRRSFRARSSGGFTFRLRDPWFYDTGRVQRVCFTQFDTRVERSVRRCRSFYVAPAAAYFMPADGELGQLFILVVTGFEAGRTLSVRLTRPDGMDERHTIRTRRMPAFAEGGEFGPLFVPRGGGFRRFASRPGDPVGLYTALVSQPGTQARARAAMMVRTAD
jgi:hypothetical protein